MGYSTDIRWRTGPKRVVDAEVQKAFVPAGQGLNQSRALKASIHPS